MSQEIEEMKDMSADEVHAYVAEGHRESQYLRFVAGARRWNAATVDPESAHPLPRETRDSFRYAAVLLEDLAAKLRSQAADIPDLDEAYQDLDEALVETLDPVRHAVLMAWLHLGKALPDDTDA